MTTTTNARIAGFTFLFYIAAGLTTMAMFGRATGGAGIAAKLAGIARHATEVRVVLVLLLMQCFAAIVLGVTLWALTREHDPHLAMLALACRVGEGVLSATSIPATQSLLWLATASGKDAPESGAAHALGAYLLTGDVALTATFFAVGSAIFCWLLLRGRMIPAPMAWLGLVASLLLVVVLPLQLGGFVHGPFAALVWLPMLAFEVPFALWLLIKGVATPAGAKTA
ncbi:MAG: DUF4386 domain-containing protein [Thermoanaerobaculia bacterium]|jgi:hypothetical protein